MRSSPHPNPINLNPSRIMKNPESEPSRPVYDLLSDLVKAVVTQPEKVSIRHTVHGPLDAFTVKVDKEDIRRVIGARGKHFKALEYIVQSACKVLNREGHLIVDEDTAVPPPSGASARVFSLRQGRPFTAVGGLLTRVVCVFVSNPNDFTIEQSDLGTTHIFELKVNAAVYSALYGDTTQFEYGADGRNIGTIKNLFDAISKNHGKLVRIVLTKRG